jgi:hypothetical protein
MNSSLGREIGYDSVRHWLARHTVSYLGEADFVDFLLAGECAWNDVTARGGMSVCSELVVNSW